MYKDRNIVQKALKYEDSEYILIFTGARQTGKTTILKHIFEELKKNNKKAYFINLEDIDYFNLLNESPKNLLSITGQEFEEKVFVFIDEIQYLKDPTNFLKFFFDEYKNKIKLIVSGSSAFYLDQKFKDSLAGRKRIFSVYPLSFYEFLLFKDQLELCEKFRNNINLENLSFERFSKIEQKQLQIYLTEFSRYGGYPKVVLENNPEEKIEIIRDLVDSFIKKDIFEAKINYPDKFLNLLKILASQIGSLLNKNELANTLDLSTSALENYINIMLRSFHIALIAPYYANLRKELTKQKKVYFYDTGLRNLLVRNFDIIDFRIDKGELFENLVFRELMEFVSIDNIKYWRTQDKNEVDFIVDDRMAFEVKFNADSFSKVKYEKFRNLYKDIRFNVIYHKGKQLLENDDIHYFKY